MIWLIFALGSLLITYVVLGTDDFDNKRVMVFTYLCTWPIVFIVLFFAFAFVIGI